MFERDLTKYKFLKKFTILQFMSFLGISALVITFLLSYFL